MITKNRKAIIVVAIVVVVLVMIAVLRAASGTGTSGALPQNKLAQQYANSLPALQKMVDKDPNNPTLLQELGVAKYATGDIQGAQAAYARGVVLDSGNAVFHNNLANTYRDLGDYAKAESEYRQAMLLDPKLTTPYLNLASIYQYILGKPDTSITIYEQGIKNNPDYVDFYNAEALVYEQEGLKTKAIQYFNKALTIQAGNPTATAGIKRLGTTK